jgi:hypothetical protein
VSNTTNLVIDFFFVVSNFLLLFQFFINFSINEIHDYANNNVFNLYMQMRNSNGRGEGTTREIKKKRSEESSEASLKKPKQDTSTTNSSSKVHKKICNSNKVLT